MPLVLRLRFGEDFFVQEERFVVDRIVRPRRAVLIHGKKVIELDFEHDTEILQDVFATIGERMDNQAVPISIDAPRHLLVLTGTNFRRGLRKHLAGPGSQMPA